VIRAIESGAMTEIGGARSWQALKVLDGTAAVALATLYLTFCAFLSSAGYAFHFGIPVELVRIDFVSAAANWLVSCVAILGSLLSFWQGVDSAMSARLFFVDTSEEPTLLLQYAGESAVGYTYRVDGTKTQLERLRVVSTSGKSLVQVKLQQSPECCLVEPLPAPRSAFPNSASGAAGALSPGPLSARGSRTESLGGVAGVAAEIAPATSVGGAPP
jgi:hypothetical protein